MQEIIECFDIMWAKYWWEFSFFLLGCWCLAIMDYFNFQVPYNSHPFWSLHTHGSKFEIWHLSKRFALLFFAISAMGMEYTRYTLVFIFYSPYAWLAVIAYIGQKLYKILKSLIKPYKNIDYSNYD